MIKIFLFTPHIDFEIAYYVPNLEVSLSTLCKFISLLLTTDFRNEFDFWKVHGIMPWGFTCTLTLQDTRSIHDSMNLPKIEFIAYIYIIL